MAGKSGQKNNNIFAKSATTDKKISQNDVNKIYKIFPSPYSLAIYRSMEILIL